MGILTEPYRGGQDVLSEVQATEEDGLLVLSRLGGPCRRRMLYLNSYGGRRLWEQVREREVPTHHLWGCVELAAMGYEVAIAEPLGYVFWRRGHCPQDLAPYRRVRRWLGRDGVIFAGHTILFWIPLLRRCGLVTNPVVSLCFAREELDHISGHSGVIAMTPAAAQEARRRSKRIKISHLSWGVDLSFYPRHSTGGESFLSCGIANRDFATLAAATRLSKQRFDVICPGCHEQHAWGSNAKVYDGGKGWNTADSKKFTLREILDRFYLQAAASLIIVNDDPTDYTANGFTNLLEAMAMERSVIMTRTGAVPGEIELEERGIGRFVKPADARSLARAVDAAAGDLKGVREMGQNGRTLCEEYYHIGRFARGLHDFFECL